MSTPDLRELVERCQTTMAHAWMVRTFVKHSPEAEDFPDLMLVARTVFDVSRALETRISDPAAYFRMLGKKVHRLRQAAEQFAIDAPQASTHTNFAQAVISIRGVVTDLEALLAAAKLAASGTSASDSPDDEEAAPSGGGENALPSQNAAALDDTEI